MINDILNYWYKIEFFTPCWPVNTKKDINLNIMELPWLKEQSNEKIRFSYDLYFGEIKSIDLIKWMLSEIKISEEESKCPLDKFTLSGIFKEICHRLNMSNKLVNFSIWARKKTQHRKKDGSFTDVEPSTELFQSFYLDDIKKVIENSNEKINKYVLAGDQDENAKDRKCIDTDVQEMKTWVAAEKFPLGAWPSTYNPSLMQKIGINICTSGEKDIFSINGPPGTGKTTLLKEIVVSNVIERAKLLVEFDIPDKAFSKAEFKSPCDQYNRSYYCMDKRLKKYGILVASNNNAAVENISLELPKIISKDRTGRFSREMDGNSDDIYFTDIASKLIGQPAWGLVSAKLGKKGNLSNLKERLWWAEDGITLKHYYDKSISNWNSARNNFKLALDNVLNERKQISYAQSLINKKPELISVYHIASNDYNQTETRLSEKQINLDCENNKLSKLTDSLNSVNDRINFLFSNMNFFQRLFRKFLKRNQIINEWKALILKKEEIILQFSKQEGACYKVKEEIDIISEKLCNCRIKLVNIQRDIDDIDKNIESEKGLFQDNWADGSFWENIEKMRNYRKAVLGFMKNIMYLEKNCFIRLFNLISHLY